LILGERQGENQFEGSHPHENQLGELQLEVFHKKNQMGFHMKTQIWFLGYGRENE